MASHPVLRTDNSDSSGSGAAAPRRSFLRGGLILFGVASLCYLLGAAVIYFEWPTSSFLRRAFLGGAAWYERRQEGRTPRQQTRAPRVGRIDQPDKTCDGFTLLMYDKGTRAVLVDMRGEEIHHWHVPFSSLWPAPPHLRGRIKDASVYFNDGHVFPNGDLLVLLEGDADMRNPSNGYGLAKLDKDSRVLWKYPEHCHHDVEVGEDGTIYALTNEIIDHVRTGLEYLHLPTPCMVDCIDVISPEGERRRRIPLLEALHDSPYSVLFGMIETPRVEGGATTPGMTRSPFPDDMRRMDVLHTNSIKVLNRALAPKFPQFKAGQLLLSIRSLDALAVLDPDSGKVVWAARGPWRAQHDAWFLDNGHLLLFDNQGSPGTSRVLEYDPKTQAFPWSYPGENNNPFVSPIRGLCQRLPNHNTLITNSVAGECFEVTSDREIVWSCSSGGDTIYRARRYTPEHLPFLEGSHRARP